ncbi:DUF1810 domain-containing protein [Adhaeribacter swui]|uniref:DUF1810 domain-containing protein n=1 Tax=Adhaeribacter swui TaxID=2086471 RepID=A0A7G7G6U2_9BACT|nr:DUF1810 domain-containing protein [Adhaeribacter swui]QNF32876.1 DUF1810 domain-containing protein [Adhaeribacter swui]
MLPEENLQRFISAQESSYPVALAEIKQGRKQSHWMWYIFPQIQGLGFSETSRYYAIQNIREAEAYLNHPVLGKRLVQICEALLQLPNNNATRIFGNPDDLKLKSSMTLFAAVKNSPPVFQEVLDKFFRGVPDQKTLQLLATPA